MQLRDDGGPEPRRKQWRWREGLDFGSTLKIESIGFGDGLDMSHEQEESKAIWRFDQTERIELLHLGQEMLWRNDGGD